ncbi:hypothetical protein M1L60_14720 [Actinoplanes sp. TRM 88003]|uniref:Lipoprotein n=1 Tax=Paractinoplanes aksuensis TaxID=2939490 RepID=A0ABT1DLY3_9ACTN|nr:hypothetical protein [Actinoplanes aksuensis]MCO8271849.1 hypothetical protein [Actinoplanes aksuensis]
MRKRYALVAVALTALSACGQEPEQRAAPKVATLSSQAPASAPPERPRERLDTTEEEFEAMLTRYYKCMDEKGALAVRVATNGRKKAMTADEVAKGEAADRICEPLYYPLPPWEKDPTNPEAADFARAVVKCLEAQGIDASIEPDGVTVSFQKEVQRALAARPGCEREAAAK